MHEGKLSICSELALRVDVLGPRRDGSEDAMHHLISVVEKEDWHPAIGAVAFAGLSRMGITPILVLLRLETGTFGSVDNSGGNVVSKARGIPLFHMADPVPVRGWQSKYQACGAFLEGLCCSACKCDICR